MHPHLHTKDNKACEEVMNALEECHARGFLYKAVGMCNKPKHAVNMCLRAQRLERTKANREQAKVKREKIEKVWAEIDANS
ncbi:Cytochrome c oxidase biogenesis protein Cmc1-like protein [Macrophomina phaseolina MS6]|uniref:COX assembly mitochondrial protein n=1 Tax=Macrophomina phaseolina (strain MS6) TaxID=1126212 RepID=K2QPP2_MACPH|nr:Cytochrome c oxidase biogenesis protein Cmc1-like protein [Macrophomina phaseolina MS6]